MQEEYLLHQSCFPGPVIVVAGPLPLLAAEEAWHEPQVVVVDPEDVIWVHHPYDLHRKRALHDPEHLVPVPALPLVPRAAANVA